MIDHIVMYDNLMNKFQWGNADDPQYISMKIINECSVISGEYLAILERTADKRRYCKSPGSCSQRP